MASKTSKVKTIKKPSGKKVVAPKATVKKTVKATVKKCQAKRNKAKKPTPKEAALQAQLTEALNKYGELLAQTTNFRLRREKMLGQILVGLYAMGIGPNEIMEMCKKVFRPVG